MSFLPKQTVNARADDSSSSGLLLYAALVDLLAEDFLSEDAQMTLRGKDKKLAFSMVLLGGGLFVHLAGTKKLTSF